MWLKDVRPEVTLERTYDQVYGKPLLELEFLIDLILVS
jgi:hypothetical protein